MAACLCVLLDSADIARFQAAPAFYFISFFVNFFFLSTLIPSQKVAVADLDNHLAKAGGHVDAVWDAKNVDARRVAVALLKAGLLCPHDIVARLVEGRVIRIEHSNDCAAVGDAAPTVDALSDVNKDIVGGTLRRRRVLSEIAPKRDAAKVKGTAIVELVLVRSRAQRLHRPHGGGGRDEGGGKGAQQQQARARGQSEMLDIEETHCVRGGMRPRGGDDIGVEIIINLL